MTNADYDVLDEFIKDVLTRLKHGNIDILAAHSAIMHPLTAWDEGNSSEFVPWMKIHLGKGKF